MNAQQLLIDVGNGRTKFGLADREAILDRREHATREISPESVREVTAGWRFDRVVLCSVVPKAVEAFREVFGEALTVLRHDTPMGIGIRYPKPETIGPDRLANAVALAHMHGAPGIVIDFGTAVTFDILSADRHYIGGVIAPGLRLMTDYLHERTALLPRVDLSEPVTAIGTSTKDAILAGVTAAVTVRLADARALGTAAGAAIGYRGMVKGILEALRKELSSPKIVATGGDAAWIVSGMEETIAVDADLTLHGLRLVGNMA